MLINVIDYKIKKFKDKLATLVLPFKKVSNGQNRLIYIYIL